MGEQFRRVATPDIGPDFGGPVDRPFAPLPGPEAVDSLVARLLDVARARPGAPVVCSGDRTLSYAGLVADAGVLAARLRKGGTGPVGVLLPSDGRYVAAVFACLAAGRVSVLLDDASPAERNAQILKAAGADTVLDSGGDQAVAFEGVTRISVDAALAAAGSDPGLGAAAGLDPDAPAFLIATSGSTGAPKLIAHSQRTMFHWARTTHNGLHVRPEDRALSLSAFASLGGFTSLLSYPLGGASLEAFDLRTLGLSGLLERLGSGEVTILRAAPSMVRMLVKLPDAGAAFRNLRVVQTYGEPLAQADVAALKSLLAPGCVIRTTWGATECSGMAWFAGAQHDFHPVLEPGGYLMPETEAYLVGLGEEGEGVGELVIRSRYNALGEWFEGAVRFGRIRPDPEAPEVRLYDTGDLARVRDGVFVILGRKDRMVKINGQRVEPAEVETALHGDPLVGEAEVFSDGASPPALLAFVRLTDPAEPSPERRLKAALRRRMPAYMVPARIFAVDEIPRLPSGKADRRRLLGGVAGRAGADV